jgi:hypothetical protein
VAPVEAKGMMRPKLPEASVTAPPLVLLPLVANAPRVSVPQLLTVGWKVRLAKPVGLAVVPFALNETL